MVIDIISPVFLVLATRSHLVSCEFNLPAIYPFFFWIISKNDQERPPLQSELSLCPAGPWGALHTLLSLREWLRGDCSQMGSPHQAEI